MSYLHQFKKKKKKKKKTQISKYGSVRDCLQISLQVLSEFKQLKLINLINYFSDFRGNEI